MSGGDWTSWTPKLDLQQVQQYCFDNSSVFMRYHKDDKVDQKRTALPITNATGQHDDSSFIVLKELDQHEFSFTKKTQHYYDSGLGSLLDKFGSSLGRTHIVNLQAGGYFRPHRDGPMEWHSPELEGCRLLYCINNCDYNNFHLILGNSVLPLKDGDIYLINAMIKHSAVSFSDECFFLMMNVKYDRQTMKALIDLEFNR
jgi:hypothetical protein